VCAGVQAGSKRERRRHGGAPARRTLPWRWAKAAAVISGV
jgi:hypothetical protein